MTHLGVDLESLAWRFPVRPDCDVSQTNRHWISISSHLDQPGLRKLFYLVKVDERVCDQFCFRSKILAFGQFLEWPVATSSAVPEPRAKLEWTVVAAGLNIPNNDRIKLDWLTGWCPFLLKKICQPLIKYTKTLVVMKLINAVQLNS